MIIEAISSYIKEQKANIFYNNFKTSSKELKEVITTNKTDNLKSIDELIDELEH